MDQFVLAGLEGAGLKPSPPADRRILIRRASLDLVGLPPAPEEVDAFVNDPEPDAFARVVDRMLASPHYGERWGRHWLDVARYSDGLGGFLDGEALPDAWHYRDWVVGALNQDLPYHEFLREQIAGGLDGSNTVGTPATGFMAIGPTYISDGGDPEAEAQARAETLADRVDTFSRAVLGLTVACARCHDHKFDPISTRDYYALAGIFNNTRSQRAPLVPPEVVAGYEAAQKAIRDQERLIQETSAGIRQRHGRRILRDSSRYLMALLELHGGRRGASNAADRDAFATARGLDSGTMQRWETFLQDEGKGRRFPVLGPWFAMQASGWVAAPDRVALETSASEFTKWLNDALDTLSRREIESADAVKAAPGPEAAKTVSGPALGKEDQALLDILMGGPGKVDLERFLDDLDRRSLAGLKADLENLRRAAPAPFPRAQVLAESGTNDMAVAIRGDLRRPGELAPRRFLGALAGENAPRFSVGSGLRQLADAVADRANPLTARVIVNRVWKHHFGQGLVRTPSNFGMLGERPTHPELLDWLAATLVEDGGSLKRLHRLILLSSSWQMGSRHDAAAHAFDGENRLLWRMTPRKLEVESWRDAQLAVTGELDATLGGPPSDRILDQPRRTLYATISRNGDRFVSDEFLRLFDFPAPRSSSETRVSSTVPQQYLFLLNSEFTAARSKKLVRRLFDERGSDSERLERAYHLLYSRPPSSEEARWGLEYLSGPPLEGPASRWESYAQVLISAHEFIQVQ